MGAWDVYGRGESLRGESESDGVLSEVARHVETETKAPMTRLVNTRPLWVSTGPMSWPIAKQSQLNPPQSEQQWLRTVTRCGSMGSQIVDVLTERQIIWLAVVCPLCALKKCFATSSSL